MFTVSLGASMSMPLVVTNVALSPSLQMQSELRLQWSQVQWAMVAGVGRLLLGFRFGG